MLFEKNCFDKINEHLVFSMPLMSFEIDETRSLSQNGFINRGLWFNGLEIFPLAIK